MSKRIVVATVAAFALALPAIAQEQAKPDDEAAQEAGQELEQAQETLQEEGAEPDQAGAAGQPAGTAEGEPTEQEVADEEPAPPADLAFIEVQKESQFLANDEVIGKEIVNVRDEELGEITDLVMDQDQKLVGVVLSVGGFLGVGEKWVAVPVEQIQFPSEDQPARLLVDVSEEQLENAPDFVTRETVEAQEAAEAAQQQMMEQQQQIPAPTATDQ